MSGGKTEMNRKAVVFAAALIVGCFSAGRAAAAPMRAEITGKPKIRYEIVPKTECRKDREKSKNGGSGYGQVSGCTVPLSLDYDISIDCSRKVLKIKLSLDFVVQIEQWIRELNDKIEFDSVMKHELTHVALYKNVYQKYAQSAAAAALAYVKKNTCSNGAMYIAYKVMEGVYDEARRQNAFIDGDENYRYQAEQAGAMREKELLARRQREEAAARKAEEKRQKLAALRQKAASVPENARLMPPERAAAAPPQTRKIACAEPPVEIRQPQKIQPAVASVEPRDQSGTPPSAVAEKSIVPQISEMFKKTERNKQDLFDIAEKYLDDDTRKSMEEYIDKDATKTIKQMLPLSDETIGRILETMDTAEKMRLEMEVVKYKAVLADKKRYMRQKQLLEKMKSPKQLSDEFRAKYNLPDPADDPDMKRRTFRTDHWVGDWVSMILDDLNDKIHYREKFGKIRDAIKGFFGKKDGGAKKSAATK